MGRLVGVLGGVLYALRLVADALLIARDIRGGRAEAEPLGAEELGGTPKAPAPDGAGGVGPGGPAAGPTARQGAGPLSGPATPG